jgi:REP element-mobilizing transposase RayT
MRDRLYVHIVWTTRARRALIDASSAAYLAEHLPIIARQERSRVIELGIVTTHLHLVVRLHPTTSIPRLLQRMKGGTAFGVNGRTPVGGSLRWAKGYSIASVSEQALDRVRGYVRDQDRRHPGESISGWHAAGATGAEQVAEATARLESLNGHSIPNVASATPAEPRL